MYIIVQYEETVIEAKLFTTPLTGVNQMTMSSLIGLVPLRVFSFMLSFLATIASGLLLKYKCKKKK